MLLKEESLSVSRQYRLVDPGQLAADSSKS